MARTTAALELKGRMLSATRIRVLDADLAAIASHLSDLRRQMPQALKGMVAVLESDFALDLPALLTALRDAGIQPVGVAEGPLAGAALAAGLAVLPKDTRPRAAEPAPAPVAAQQAPRRSTRVITEPVRSGQQIYAEDADLVVLSAVSPGAEVIADGCVHVYGPLRGRALAGARGDDNARVFARRFEAELVAIAGVYAVADQIQNAKSGEATQAYLHNGKLVIEPLH
ncbi:MAG: septum site-determining protein MinC [Stagnimonas sp.]|nr:septum site-determining protein MinC [Stagnimonas sp.]